KLKLDNECVVDADSVAHGPALDEDEEWIYMNYGPTSRLRLTVVDNKILRSVIFQPLLRKSLRVQLVKTHKQIGSKDCGLFAIAMATAVLIGQDPKVLQFHQQSIREHLMDCFEAKKITPFPLQIS
uniref:Ubiquitin-like protease family profile domain-containing protein n=1 Tax=Amphimedon queenslandica TaxID=400682 RepID=A0A1X7TU44_AMPQE